MGDLQQSILVLRLQEIKWHLKSSGWKQKFVEFQTVPSPAAPLGGSSKKREMGQTPLRTMKLTDLACEMGSSDTPPASWECLCFLNLQVHVPHWDLPLWAAGGLWGREAQFSKSGKDPWSVFGSWCCADPTTAKRGGKCFNKSTLPSSSWLHALCQRPFPPQGLL